MRLLWELQRSIAEAPALVAPPRLGPGTIEDTANSTPLLPQSTTACLSCGRKNPSIHRFRGGCGRAVTDTGVLSNPRIGDHNSPDRRALDPTLGRLAADCAANIECALPMEIERSSFAPSEFAAAASGVIGVMRIKNEPKLGSGGDVEKLIQYPAPSWSRRSYALLAAVVVAILGVAYVASRDMLPAKAMRQREAQAPVSSSKASEPASDRPDLPPVIGPGHSPTAQRQDAPPPEQTLRGTLRGTQPMTQAADKEPLASDATTTGAEELATAIHYLNGTDGVDQDSGKAAEWLWKAVSKRNADAPLILANLYLKGKGVEKNCDQARLLLDDAVRKGTPSAGQQLRYIHAFGCP